MGLDVKGFLKQKFEPRTKDVPVPQLRDWFSPNDDEKVKELKPVWRIRSLSASEFGLADESVANEDMGSKLIDAITAMNSDEVATKVKELMGKSDTHPKQIEKRIFHLMYASVDPKCPLELAVKVCDNFPILFFELTNEILNLSNMGFEPGKSVPSGVTKKSKQQ